MPALSDKTSEDGIESHAGWLPGSLNHFLHQRIRAYKYYGISLSAFDQSDDLPDLKTRCLEFARVHSQVRQEVARRGNAKRKHLPRHARKS